MIDKSARANFSKTAIAHPLVACVQGGNSELGTGALRHYDKGMGIVGRYVMHDGYVWGNEWYVHGCMVRVSVSVSVSASVDR